MAEVPPLSERLASQAEEKEETLSFLKSLEIEATTIDHPPAATCEEHAAALASDAAFASAIAAKNLLVRSKLTKNFYLILAPADAVVHMGDVRRQLGLKNKDQLRFAGEEDLWRLLRTAPGSCNPFSLRYDTGNEVTVLLERSLVADRTAQLVFHPMTNTASTVLSVPAFVDVFLPAIGRTDVQVVDGSEQAAE
jgi:hypothetical protein